MFHLQLAKSWHIVFALHLELYVNGVEQRHYDVESVCNEQLCDLGIWIDEVTPRLGHLARFSELKVLHKQFHLVACDLIRQHQKPDPDAARRILETTFRQASDGIVRGLDLLSMEVDQQPSNSLLDEVDLRVPTSSPLTSGLLAIGVPLIDAQHEALADAVIRLQKCPNSSLNAEDAAEILTLLQKLIFQHFDSEEMFMRQCGLAAADYQAHCAEHTRILTEMTQWQLDAMSGKNRKVSDILPKLLEFVIDHLIHYDSKIQNCL